MNYEIKKLWLHTLIIKIFVVSTWIMKILFKIHELWKNENVCSQYMNYENIFLLYMNYEIKKMFVCNTLIIKMFVCNTQIMKNMKIFVCKTWIWKYENICFANTWIMKIFVGITLIMKKIKCCSQYMNYENIYLQYMNYENRKISALHELWKH